jgi:hypothetical protein
VVPLELEAQDFEIATLTFDVLRVGAAGPGERCEQQECGVDPETYPGEAHSVSARAPGG